MIFELLKQFLFLFVSMVNLNPRCAKTDTHIREPFITPEDFEYARTLMKKLKSPDTGAERIDNIAPNVTKPDYSPNLSEGDVNFRGRPLRFVVDHINNTPMVHDDVIDLDNAVSDKLKIWTFGLVPHRVSLKFNDTQRAIIAMAMEEFHNKTCIQWIKARPNEQDYVMLDLAPNPACSSEIGKNPGKNQMLLSPICLENMGNIVHEMMHALGFIHEHCRHDRDKYVDIQWDNIPNGRFNKNYLIYGLDVIDNLNTNYDYSSVMHYPRYNKGKEIVVPKIDVKIGQRDGLSPNDVYKIKKLYNCDGADDLAPICDRKIECVRKAQDGYCKTKSVEMLQNCSSYCALCSKNTEPESTVIIESKYCCAWARQGKCEINPRHMKIYCHTACGTQGATVENADNFPTNYPPDCKSTLNTGIGGCRNKHSDCYTWAERGECDINDNRNRCPLACKNCEHFKNIGSYCHDGYQDCFNKHIPACEGSNDYRGSKSTTRNGIPCQMWTLDSPHSHHDSHDLPGNICSNPHENPDGVWCYTTDPDQRWDYCFHSCPVQGKSSMDCASEKNLRWTESGLKCQRWDATSPHIPEAEHSTFSESEDYCRETSDRIGGPWCYTTDPYVVWESCSTVICCDLLNIEFWFGDFFRFPAKDVGQCCSLCRLESKCTAFSFYPEYRFCRLLAFLDPHSARYSNRTDGSVISSIVRNSTINDNSSIDCALAKDLRYVGQKRWTATGLKCQRWDGDGIPHIPDADHSEFSEDYCRVTSDRPDGPWCYTTDPNVVWDYCFTTCSDNLTCWNGHRCCPIWANTFSQCSQNSEWMNANCMVSCGQCTPTFTYDLSCKDYYSKCPQWAANDQCSLNRDWMNMNCRVSCKSCDLFTSSPVHLHHHSTCAV